MISRKRRRKEMSTMVTSESKAVPPVVSSVRDIPLESIRESSSNPRRVFDDCQLRELAANIQLHGVLQAILVRPSPDGAEGMYELVAGARRFRASKLAGKRTIPATVRNLTDAEAQEIRLIENLQRSSCASASVRFRTVAGIVFFPAN